MTTIVDHAGDMTLRADIEDDLTVYLVQPQMLFEGTYVPEKCLAIYSLAEATELRDFLDRAIAAFSQENS